MSDDDLVAELRDWNESVRDNHRPDQRGFCRTCSLRMPCDWASILDDVTEAADEIERLRQWRAEGMDVLDGWMRIVAMFPEAMDRPSNLGRSQSAVVADEIEQLRTDLASWHTGARFGQMQAEIERLRSQAADVWQWLDTQGLGWTGHGRLVRGMAGLDA